jgi:CPA2 family monovalent cation:H+ antiporter-2
MDLILTLTGGLTAALVLGFVAQRLRLSPIVGYLAGGIAVGPFTPGFVAHAQLANECADIGIILLMFGVGLSFHVKELLAVRKVAIPGATFGVLAATAFGAVVGRSFGWPVGASVVFGLAIGVASTVVVLRVLADNDAVQTPEGHVAVGWLVVEDLLTVLVLVLLPALGGHEEGTTFAEAATAVLVAVLKVAALVAFTMIVGGRLVPKILGYAASTRSRELFTLTVLVLALGIAVGSAKLFGASMALGAFLAGMVVGQSRFSARAASEALPMRDAFAVLFFVSVGMLFDPAQLVANGGLVLATLAVVLVGKPLAVYGVMRLLRQPAAIAVTTAVAVAQIGEFSFVIAALGRKLGLMSDGATQAIVVASMASITLNPILYRRVKPRVVAGPPAEENAPLVGDSARA